MPEEMTPEQALTALDSRDFYKLTDAIETIRQNRYAPAVRKLAMMLDSPTVDVGLIVKVAKALSEIGTPLALDVLKTYLFAETTQLSRHAYEQTTFEKISRSAIVSAAAKRALKELNTPQSQAILDEWEQQRKKG